MKTSQKGIDLIKNFEGLRLKAYLCPAKVWTIGYGHTGADVKEGLLIGQAQAENLLRNDLQRFENSVNAYVKVKLNQNQFDALVSFAYNVGIEALSKSTLVKFLNQGLFNQAANQFDRWVNANGKPLSGLVARRAKEKALFLRGVIA